MALVKCSECKSQMSDTASNCPKCGAPINLEAIENNTKKDKNNLIGCLGIFGAIILASIIIGAINSGKSTSQSDDSTEIETSADDHTLEAYVYCQQTVEANLKSPSTAEHPYMSDISITQDGNYYIINGYVDSQNSFGAILRENYHCKLKYDNGIFSAEEFYFK